MFHIIMGFVSLVKPTSNIVKEREKKQNSKGKCTCSPKRDCFIFHPIMNKMANIVLTLEVTLLYFKKLKGNDL